MLARRLLRFVRDLKELGEHLLLLKQLPCPVCGAAETLNRHSKLHGNDPASQGGCLQRGQRVWCSSRGQRGGCGRSFSVFLGNVLPRHTVNASALGALLERRLAGDSTEGAVQRLGLPFPLETLYHLLGRVRQRLPSIRSALCRETPAPAGAHADPLLQTAEHLRRLFPKSPCACGEFQWHFQRPLLE